MPSVCPFLPPGRTVLGSGFRLHGPRSRPLRASSGSACSSWTGVPASCARTACASACRSSPCGSWTRCWPSPGEPVTREALRQRLWPDDTFVDFDNGLNRAINRLRAALGDEAGNPRFIETLERRGYRFIAPVGGAGRCRAGAAGHRARGAAAAAGRGGAAGAGPARGGLDRRRRGAGGRALDRGRGRCCGGTPRRRTAPPSVHWPSCRWPT